MVRASSSVLLLLDCLLARKERWKETRKGCDGSERVERGVFWFFCFFTLALESMNVKMSFSLLLLLLLLFVERVDI